jgi:hypothetical protein
VKVKWRCNSCDNACTVSVPQEDPDLDQDDYDPPFQCPWGERSVYWRIVEQEAPDA